MKTADLLLKPDLYTTVALAVVLDRYGTECLEWDPAILADAVETDFRIDAPPSLLNKLNAGVEILTSNRTHAQIEVFLPVCSALTSGIVFPGDFVPVSLESVSWGVTEMSLLDGEEFGKDAGPDVARYVGVLLDQAGIYLPPSYLKFALYPEPSGLTERLSGVTDQTDLQYYYRQQADRRAALTTSVLSRTGELLRQLNEMPGDINRDFLKSYQSKVDSKLKELAA